jgi:tetratricopeptide (TPR) repeat protein/tRNA A-37 threonylcarbamoyl transferase component Bud32
VDDFFDRVRSSITGLRRRRLAERARAAKLLSTAQADEVLAGEGDPGEKMVAKGWISRAQLDELKAGLDAPDGASGFARYELTGILGEGAMSVVHRARDRQLGREVAVKVLRESLLSHPIVAERFTREAQALARLDHPGIVRVYDSGMDAGRAYLVMELVEGESLSKKLAAKSTDLRAKVRLLEKVARAVHHAHEKGVIHRDLKPDNILVAGEEPKVADFGLARLVESSPALTRSGAVMGTPMYMAPEQVEGGREVTVRTDVHALGVLLYEMLTGRPPHVGESIPEVYAKISRDDAVPPRQVDATIPWELEAVAMKALEKSPDRRYGSAADVAEDLRRWQAGEPVSARPLTGVVLLWRRTRKRMPLLLALVPALLLLVALGAVVRGAHRREQGIQDAQKALRGLEEARPALEKARAAQYTNTVEPAQMLRSLQEADGRIDSALALAPDQPLGWYLRGEVLELRGDYARAEQSFSRAVELDPRFGPARYHLGRVLLCRAYISSLAVWPDEREIRRAEGEQLARQAIREITEAQGSGFDNDLQREVAAAMLAHLRGAKEEVRRICRDGIARFGTKEGAEEFPWLLGLVLDSKEAQQKAFNQALALRPKFPLALYSRASVRERDAAIQDYDRALAISPGFAEAVLNRGSLRWAKGDAKGAYEDFDRLIKQGDLLSGAYNGRGRTVLELMNDPDRALPDLDEAIRLRPEGYVLPYIARARAHLLKKNYDAAIADATKALSISAWSDPFFTRGLAKLAKGDREGARPDLEEALKRGPADGPVRHDILKALEQARQK